MIQLISLIYTSKITPSFLQIRLIILDTMALGCIIKPPFLLKSERTLSFDESNVVEFNFDRKKIFFAVLNRSPPSTIHQQSSPTFLSDCTNLYSKIKSENPYVACLREISMLSHSHGGRMEILPLEELK